MLTKVSDCDTDYTRRSNRLLDEIGHSMAASVKPRAQAPGDQIVGTKASGMFPAYRLAHRRDIRFRWNFEFSC